VAILLAEQGHSVRLFDPLGVMRAASTINQYRLHAGYHYPRSPETVQETQEARAEFIRAFEPAIVETALTTTPSRSKSRARLRACTKKS
jgi:hypothetical protein